MAAGYILDHRFIWEYALVNSFDLRCKSGISIVKVTRVSCKKNWNGFFNDHKWQDHWLHGGADNCLVKTYNQICILLFIKAAESAIIRKARITYNTVASDLPDIYAHTLRIVAFGLGLIYQANPSWPCYNYYI